MEWFFVITLFLIFLIFSISPISSENLFPSTCVFQILRQTRRREKCLDWITTCISFFKSIFYFLVNRITICHEYIWFYLNNRKNEFLKNSFTKRLVQRIRWKLYYRFFKQWMRTRYQFSRNWMYNLCWPLHTPLSVR